MVKVISLIYIKTFIPLMVISEGERRDEEKESDCVVRKVQRRV